MIYAIGDSHSESTFRNIKQIKPYKFDSRTMYRVGRDGLNLPKEIKNQKDIVIWCFGEIDVRCHIKKQESLERSIDEILTTLVDSYFLTILRTRKNLSYSCYVMSVVPSAYKENSNENSLYPFVGTNQERSFYTIRINQLIRQQCEKNDYQFLDVYSLFADDNGMLKKELSDGHVHIGDNSSVLTLLSTKKMI